MINNKFNKKMNKSLQDKKNKNQKIKIYKTIYNKIINCKNPNNKKII